MAAKFASTLNRGFQMTFANGWEVSVQFGAGNYCPAKMNGMSGEYLDPLKTPINECENAEVQIFYNGEPVGEPVGWQTPDQVAKIIAGVAEGKDC